MMKRYILAFLIIIPNLLFSAFQKEKLGNGINTECEELNPVITSDGQTLYFCRESCNAAEKQDDIWYTTLDENNQWAEPMKMKRPLNDKYSNVVSSVSADGNTLLLGTVYNTDGSENRQQGVSLSYRTSNGWSFPENIVIENYYNRSSYAGFYLNANSDILLMTIERDDANGNKDIYVSFKKQCGTWSEPQNLGFVVNSDQEELTPYLAADNETLYFSSSGHGGFGGVDVFVSRRLDDSWKNWTKPKNLGSEVNTVEWDASFKIDAFGQYAYFSSSSVGSANNDIYRLELKPELKPKPVLLVKGNVRCFKSLAPIEAEINFEKLAKQKEYIHAKSNPRNGMYTQTLPAGFFYEINPTAHGYLGHNDKIDLVELEEFEEINLDLEMIPSADSLICIRNIFFGFADSMFSERAYCELDRLAEFLVQEKATVVEIEGYTDNIGSNTKNIKLSKKRALSAKQYLMHKGIAAKRIQIFSRGKTNYIMSNHTEEGRVLNRRVEFKVYEIHL